MGHRRIAIVGAGHAGGALVRALRKHGHEGGIVVVGAEPHLPYQRPPLSKQVLAGKAGVEEVTLNPASLYERVAADLVLGRTAVAIDRERRTLSLDDGRTVEWDGLAIATGARPRILRLPGHDLPGIHLLRTLDDAVALRDAFRPGARLAVVGGGYIGLEVAASAALAGLAVTVLEAGPRLMARAVSPVLSAHFLALHRSRGVDVRLGVGVTGFEGEDGLEAVATSDGRVAADLAVVGVGAVPETALAEAAGLAVDDGILVDAFAATSDPAIVAAGDCTRFPSLLYGGRMLRLESVQNAVDQAEAAARTLCGRPEPYQSVPWFWSDQYDAKLQIAGLHDGHDEAFLSGDPASGAFSVSYRRDGRLIAVEAVNAPRDYMAARRTIAAGGAGDVAELVRLPVAGG